MSVRARFVIYTLSLLFLFLICQLTLKGLGAGSSERNAFLFMCFILILSFSKKIFWCIAFPVFLIQALYIPVGKLFGLPTYQSVASLQATNAQEAKEFLSQIPLSSLIYSAGVILAMIGFRYIYTRLSFKNYSNHLVISSFAVVSFFGQDSGVFFKEAYSSIRNMKGISNELTSYTNDWRNVSVINKKYNTYVLIIGESVRADYLNAYGYPLENTPFMSNNGLVVNGLIAGGSNTIASLSNMLTRNNNGTGNFNKNIVDLANSAGFKTYWLSNQDSADDISTPISAIASKSDYRDFTKKGAFVAKNTSDFLLIDKFNKALADDTHERKFIVVHLYGSHPRACARVEDYPVYFTSDNSELSYVDCYVNSIKKTDEIIESLYSALNKRYQDADLSYTLTYFADHGLLHGKFKKEIRFVHGYSMNSFSVPLFTLSSDARESRQCDALKSGLKFIDGLASWMGVHEESLDHQFQLFDCKDDPSAPIWLERLQPNFVEDIGAIDISR